MARPACTPPQWGARWQLPPDVVDRCRATIEARPSCCCGRAVHWGCRSASRSRPAAGCRSLMAVVLASGHGPGLAGDQASPHLQARSVWRRVPQRDLALGGSPPAAAGGTVMQRQRHRYRARHCLCDERRFRRRGDGKMRFFSRSADVRTAMGTVRSRRQRVATRGNSGGCAPTYTPDSRRSRAAARSGNLPTRTGSPPSWEAGDLPLTEPRYAAGF